MKFKFEIGQDVIYEKNKRRGVVIGFRTNESMQEESYLILFYDGDHMHHWIKSTELTKYVPDLSPPSHIDQKKLRNKRLIVAAVALTLAIMAGVIYFGVNLDDTWYGRNKEEHKHEN